MRVRATTLLSAAVAAAAMAAGCGGSGGDPTDTAQSLTKAEFIGQANAICREQQAGLPQRVAEYEQRLEGRTPARGADMVHFVYLPTIETQVWKIRALGTPPGQEETIARILDLEQYAIDGTAVLPRVPSIAAAASHFGRANAKLRSYGLDACISRAGRQ